MKSNRLLGRFTPRGVSLAMMAALSLCSFEPVNGEMAEGGVKGAFGSLSDAARVELAKVALEGRRVAVVIGIDDFQDRGFKDLNFAADDARSIAQILKNEKYGGFDEVTLLSTPKETTKEQILHSIAAISQDLQRGDTLLIYISSHGTLYRGTKGDLNARPILVATDTNIEELDTTGIDLVALGEDLRGVRARHKAVIVDACFSGEGKSALTTEDAQWITKATERFWSEIAGSIPESGAVLLATAFGGIAEEDPALRHGVFTHHLLLAMGEMLPVADLDNDGAVNLYEALDYVRGGVLTYNKDSARQVPQGLLRVGGTRAFYLSGQPDPNLAMKKGWIVGQGGDDRGGRGLSVEVDGTLRGDLPRSIPIEAGLRQVRLEDESGALIASGRVRFGMGQVYTLDMLMETLISPRRFFGVRAGQVFSITGEASEIWGDVYARTVVTSGYRIKSSWLRGSYLEGEVGYGYANGMHWLSEVGLEHRNLFDGGVRVGFGRSISRLYLGGSYGLSAFWVPSVVDKIDDDVDTDFKRCHGDYSSGSETIEAYYAPTCELKGLAHGPSLSVGYAFNRSFKLVADSRLLVAPRLNYLEDLPKESLTRNRQFSASLGAELNF